MRRVRSVAAGVAATAVLGGLAGGCNPAQLVQAVSDALQDCSVTGENRFVRDTMRDIYFWYRELPDLRLLHL